MAEVGTAIKQGLFPQDGTVRATAPAVSGLSDFDDLHTQQLNLGAAVLQHLLGDGQHLPVLSHQEQTWKHAGTQ